jgi:hypothetical protein
MWCDITGIGESGKPCTAMACLIEDSGDGACHLVFGGAWGCGSRPAASIGTSMILISGVRHTCFSAAMEGIYDLNVLRTITSAPALPSRLTGRELLNLRRFHSHSCPTPAAHEAISSSALGMTFIAPQCGQIAEALKCAA